MKNSWSHLDFTLGASLVEQGIEVAHIDESGELKTQDEVIALLTGGQLNLFGEISMTSRKRYRSQDSQMPDDDTS